MEVKRIGVVGAGQMGSGIAQVAASAGYEVVLVDVAESFLERGLAAIRRSLGKFLEKGKITQEAHDEALGRIRTSLSLEDLKDAFARRPDFPLRWEDFVAVEAGWQPKSESLRALATGLNLGLDSFVFLDDSSLECAEVRAALPALRASDQVQAGQQGMGQRRRRCRGVDIGPGALHQPFNDSGVGRDKRAPDASGFAQGADINKLGRAQRKMFEHAGTMGTEHAKPVRIVHHTPCPMPLAQCQQCRQRRNITFHTKDAVGDDKFGGGDAGTQHRI